MMDILYTDSKKIAEFNLEFVIDSEDSLEKLYRDLQCACTKIYCEQSKSPGFSVTRISCGFAIPKGVAIENVFARKRRYIVDVYVDMYWREFRLEFFIEDIGRGENGEHRVILLFFTLHTLTTQDVQHYDKEEKNDDIHKTRLGGSGQADGADSA